MAKSVPLNNQRSRKQDRKATPVRTFPDLGVTIAEVDEFNRYIRDLRDGVPPKIVDEQAHRNHRGARIIEVVTGGRLQKFPAEECVPDHSPEKGIFEAMILEIRGKGLGPVHDEANHRRHKRRVHPRPNRSSAA